ncbi:MAG: N-acetylglucosamine-6-phosphate deacetylase [Verrucomicrobiota bacterium]
MTELTKFKKLQLIMRVTILKNGKIILPDKILVGGSVIVRDGVIEEVLEKRKTLPRGKEIDLKGNYLSPGFIDLHVHGALGRDTMEANLKAWDAISRFHFSKGTTHFALTTVASPWENLERVLRLAKQKTKLSGAQLLGIHVEGPFLNKNKAGAHCAEFLRFPKKEEWQKILKYSDCITQMTLAPELSGTLALIRELKKRNIIASAGHTDATEKEMACAFSAGLDHATHLFNRMAGGNFTHSHSSKGGQNSGSSLHIHRSCACATMTPCARDAVKFILENNIYAEIIADGIHVPVPLLKETWKRKGTDRLILITDATAGAGLSVGKKFLVGEGMPAQVFKNCARTCESGVLAGSTIGMIDAVKIMVQKVGVPLHEAVRMATLNPALRIGLKNKGVIQECAYADLIAFNRYFRVSHTWR